MTRRWPGCAGSVRPQVRIIRDDVKRRVEELLKEKGWAKQQ